MNKIIALNKILIKLQLYNEAERIIKLARETDEKYTSIAYKILEYIKDNPPKSTLISNSIGTSFSSISFQSYFIPYHILNQFFKEADLLTPNEMSSVGETEFIKNGLTIIIYPPISDSKIYNFAESRLKNDSAKIDAFIKSMDLMPGRKWKNIGGSAAPTNNYQSLVINLYPSPLQFFDGRDVDLANEKWINGLGEKSLNILIHEISHTIDFRRYGKEINRKPIRSFTKREDAPSEYLNSYEEIQARLMQIFADLKIILLEACPDLDIKKFLSDEEDKDTIEYDLLSAINDGDFLEFKEIIFEDALFSEKLLLDLIKSEKTKKKYSFRLYDMFNFFRRLFKLEA